MFGTYPALANLPTAVKVDPKDIPPPTPLNLPTSRPQPHAPSAPSGETKPLTSVLQNVYRSGDVTSAIFDALGINLIPDATPADLIPDPACLADFEAWDKLTPDEAREKNAETRKVLNNGVQSPGCQTYLDRKRELSHDNEVAFRTVRRIPAPKGQQQARLGNSYEFFRCLEAFTTYWDDTSKPLKTPEETGANNVVDADKTQRDNSQTPELPRVIRTSAGSSMPGEYRQSLITAFLKLVAYDFGCNVSAPRTEPRLHITAASPASDKRQAESLPAPRVSYFASGCTFIFRTPRTRDAARQGIIEGPLAAVSARATTSFENDNDQTIDLARELVAALVTAQHRAREGKTEKRFGEGQWWTSKSRWGGGEGGPIGREVERDAIQGDKDNVNSESGQPPASKRPRKNMSIYDNYRMVRPPSASWDKKTRYEAIGKVQGTGYDDIFVISSLFHHVSFLRVRVPERLLEVLEGADENDVHRSWGQVEVRRTPWFDFFVLEERLNAMRLVWSLMNWLMRKPEDNAEEDVKMVDA
ncbi:hypothetical protein CGMCC3_g11382 [Colletotrichum fructicola]|uniref:Uncharacterized protein n=1 Tax=Colletotrichum fructicola (strain Nara gc5) TaxID=1213859 RepID=L2G9Q6_COLFN|nr:uncharacterized protein CGMCC3_g11382 [Colletotrichum fructicola]KAE9572493.1 hypothetical protein CGMCC3_g11382 [Colletotrichum fructicola]KAF4416703.1 hypothetical protein CFRS1_v003663 [Colletotrichum fructicola]KAF4483645.1 hypothetical protein CGGC5_v007854 [Colletotrichum fructicola Nara gc5]